MFCQLVAICMCSPYIRSKMSIIRLKNIVIAWSLGMYGKWMNQMLPFMMQANFKHYFNKLWIIFIWLILLSFLLDDRGHFSKCITVFHQVLFKYFTLENSMIFNIRDFYPKELTLKIMRWVSFTQHATKPLSDCLRQVYLKFIWMCIIFNLIVVQGTRTFPFAYILIVK